MREVFRKERNEYRKETLRRELMKVSVMKMIKITNSKQEEEKRGKKKFGAIENKIKFATQATVL